MSTPAELPTIGTTITKGRTQYVIVRYGCASHWTECPHGNRAVTCERIDRKGHGTHCFKA